MATASAAIGCATALLIGLSGCAPFLPSATREVVYEVSGTADSVEITYTTPDGTVEELLDLTDPTAELRYEIAVPAGRTYYAAVTVFSRTPGERIACSITVDGTEIESESDDKAVASCTTVLE
jgi:hypothetical protein